MLNVAEPRSKKPPCIEDPSTRSSSATAMGTTGRPRSPAVQNSARRSTFGDSTIGVSDPSACSIVVPSPRRAKNR